MNLHLLEIIDRNPVACMFVIFFVLMLVSRKVVRGKLRYTLLAIALIVISYVMYWAGFWLAARAAEDSYHVSIMKHEYEMWMPIGVLQMSSFGIVAVVAASAIMRKLAKWLA